MAKKQYKRRTVSRKRKKNNRWNKQKKFITAGLLLLLLAVATPFAYRFFIQGPRQLFHTFDSNTFSDKYVVRGVDVSHHNSFINWNQLREENITFVYLKSAEGDSHKDRDYLKNYRLAKKAGLKVGTYHFYTFGMDGEQQAEHFIRSSNVHSQDLVPAIDVEHSSINQSSRDKKFLKRTILELKRLEQTLFEHYGMHPILYTNKECYKKYIKGRFPKNPIWICDLHSEPGDDYENWIIWQFSHTGQVDGVIGDIDLNYYRYSFSEFQKLLIP